VRAALPADGWVWPIVFDSPSARVAVASHSAAGSTLLVFDARAGTQLAQRELPLRPELLSFSAAGDELLLYGQPRGDAPGFAEPDPPRVVVLNAATLETSWEQTLDGGLSGYWCSASCEAEHSQQVYTYWAPAVALAPDRRALYIMHADAERLSTVDWAARDVNTVELGRATSWLEHLLHATAGVASAKGTQVGAFKQAVISPDGAPPVAEARRIFGDVLTR